MTGRVHISLPVKELQPAIDFYSAVFNVPPSKVKDDYANFRLDAPAIHLALTLGADPLRQGTGRHFGVELPTGEALAAVRSRLEARNIPMKLEESVTCCYAVANKVWVQDPDGHRWELWVFQGDADAMTEASGAGPLGMSADEPNKASGCCAPAS